MLLPARPQGHVHIVDVPPLRLHLHLRLQVRQAGADGRLPRGLHHGAIGQVLQAETSDVVQGQVIKTQVKEG